MNRWAHLDTDAERLPEGMKRVGYDANTQTYTYEDARGSPWEGAPGAQYGRLRRASTEPRPVPPPSYAKVGEKRSGVAMPAYVLATETYGIWR